MPHAYLQIAAHETYTEVMVYKYSIAGILTSTYCTYAYRNAVALYRGRQTGEKDSVVLWHRVIHEQRIEKTSTYCNRSSAHLKDSDEQTKLDSR